MRLTRILIHLAMIVIILPWGAYARAYAAAPAAPLEISEAVVTQGARLSAPRTCRTAVVPGFGCAMDPVIEPVRSGAFAGTAAFLWSGNVVWAKTGWGDPPPKAPPRPV